MAHPKMVEELLRILTDGRAVPELRSYFNIETPDTPPKYTGARFDSLDRGGSRDDVRDVITPYDLLAVTCLDVTVPTPVALELVEGQLGRGIGTCHRNIPVKVDLGEPSAKELVAPGSPAEEAWDLLEASDNVGWVIAGKILAWKRPRLIPVWDNVVKCAFGHPPRPAWLWLDGRLQDSRLREELDQLHRAAELPELVSSLRVLDVVVWMRHCREHRRARCPGLKLLGGPNGS